MPRAASYPPWVMAYLEPGIYVNHVNGRYYLYRAHAEYQPGVPYPVRVCDGYIGRVTQEKGLIPSKGTVKEVETFTYGPEYAVAAVTERILSGLETTYGKKASLYYVCGILWYLYGFYDPLLYSRSWLSMKYPKLKMNKVITEDEAGIERAYRMICSAAQKAYGEDQQMIRAYFAPVVLVRVNRRLYCAAPEGEALKLAQKYGLSLEWEG